MIEKLIWEKFKNININDVFFSSLKEDYPEFCEWYNKKHEEEALTYSDENGLHAFMYLKKETESIILADKILPAIDRLKIGTLKLDDSIKGQRLGEGFIGVALWTWQKLKVPEIYLTVFPKQKQLIELLKKFGFTSQGKKPNGEIILLKNRNSIDYTTPYTSFPFIDPKTKSAGLIPIKDFFHDRLFPYSDTPLKLKNLEETTAGNGITKIYIGTPYTIAHYRPGEVVFIYRMHTGDGQKGNLSAVTSFCVITKITTIKHNGRELISFQDYLKEAGNKTVFTEDELRNIFKASNVVMIEMVYNGYFEKRNDVTYFQLKNRGLFEDHPYKIEYSFDDMNQILRLGGVDVQNIIINQT